MKLQGTIKQAVALEGKGIHSGADVKLKIKNAPVNTGVIFIRTDLSGRPKVPAVISSLSAFSGNLRRTSIEKGGVSVFTVEHLLAALAALGIDNAEIEIDNAELPALDGSALPYASELLKAGRLNQKKEKKELVLKNAVWCGDGDTLLAAIPAEIFSISYLLEENAAGFMAQCANFSFGPDGEEKTLFIREIAPARTFCMESEVANILARGLGKGGNCENNLVIKNGKPVNNEFRFDNEPARHKVLDLLGDLALLGSGLKAHVVGIKSGHSLNAKFLRKLEKLL